ncbi:MAG: FdhF/YdeP family oxidoreductase [Phycisphaerales bacterium]|nr:FdhF/YdeP family oxidoreductase [Phycisphaerales bacterium]
MVDARGASFVSPEILDAGLAISAPMESVGGPVAVATALSMSVKQMGVARTIATLSAVNQSSGFTCPGCAWPDPSDRRSVAEFCENGAKAVAEEATLARATRDLFRARSVVSLSQESDLWLGRQGRLTEPMYLARGAQHYEPISWESAFATIAAELRALDSPNEAIFYTSGRTSNEAAFLYQLFVRLYGTNNLPDCSNMCHESSGLAMTQTIGTGKGTISLEDFDHADCIVVIGQNPGTNHPRMLKTLQAAARRGCTIVSINPLAEAGLKAFANPQEIGGLLGVTTALASIHLPVKVNGDVALLRGIQKAILEDAPACINGAFIERYTHGFELQRDSLVAEKWSVISEGSGISEPSIRSVAMLIAKSKAMICCWAMGVTQHCNALSNIQEIINLLLLGGHFGRPGAGACPVRGHSNVQGDRTMGICEQPTEEFLRRLGSEFQFSPPTQHGFATVGAIEAMHAGKAKVFCGLGGNFLSATPDTAMTARALNRCRLTVQISTKLNRSHLIAGEHALILPCLGRSERDVQRGGAQFVTVENSMGVVQASQGHLQPASESLWSETAIVAGVAQATLGVDWSEFTGEYDRIRDRIARVIPGFEEFNRRVRAANGFVLAHSVRDRCEFNTPSGRAHFTPNSIPVSAVGPNQFLLTTIRSHDQFNTTMYGNDDRYRGVRAGRRVVYMNRDDIVAQGLVAGDAVDLISHHRGVQRRAHQFRVVAFAIPPGSVATYFPEANVLVPIDHFAQGSQTPASKSVVVSVEKVAHKYSTTRAAL